MADGIDMTEMMKRAVQANAKFYKGWIDLTLEYVRGMSAILGNEPEQAAPIAEMDASTGALVIEGEAGEAARGAFLVTNDLGRALNCEFVSSAFNDALGARVDVKPVFDPPRIELAPGEQRVIQVAMTIDRAMKAGAGYAGEFSIAGMDGFAVPVVLRRLHRVDEAVNDKKVERSDDTDRHSEGSSTSAGTPAKRRAASKATKKQKPGRPSR